MRFGEKLRKIRQERDLTQPDLAEQLGIEQSWLSKLENDKSIPSSELLEKVCQVLGFSLECLIADLDPDYLRSQLVSLPEVRSLLQAKRYTLVHNARRWLLTATTLVAVGITLYAAGTYRWLFSEVLFHYESQGIVYVGEPEHLFDDPDGSLMPLAIEQIEQLQETGELNGYYRANISRLHEFFLAKNLSQLHQRNNSDTQITYQHRGDYYRVETTVPEDSTNIYGDTIATDSPAHRIYALQGTSPNPRWQNTVFKILGALLSVFGLLLYFVEWRMGKAVNTA